MDRMSDRFDHFRELKRRGERIAVLTAYDYPTARLLDESGIDAILVGDSLGMVVLGYPDTTHVTMEEMLHHTRAVARAAKRAPVIADLPIASYDTPADAVENGRRLLDAGAHAVKLEGGCSHADQITALTSAGVAVMGHIGMLPQSVRVEGGYRIKGRSEAEADSLVADALAVERAGAFAMVLELVQPETARRISGAVQAPTIGIGSGSGCDGQVLVTHDLVGMFPWFRPKFVVPKANVGGDIRAAAEAFIRDTRSLRAP
jgi:3-methyl-2-oxobutanoate hydroxymethyltransferase